MKSIHASLIFLITMILLMPDTVSSDEQIDETVKTRATEERPSEDLNADLSQEEFETEDPTNLDLPEAEEGKIEEEPMEEVLPEAEEEKTDEKPTEEVLPEEPSTEEKEEVPVEVDTVETIEEIEKAPSIITIIFPATITFPSVPISNEDIELTGVTGGQMEMEIEHSGDEDSRKLSVQAEPFHTADGQILENAFFYEDTVGTPHLIENTPYQVLDMSEVDAAADTTIQIGLEESDRFLLRTNPLFAKSETTYTSTVTWTLTDGP